MGKKDPTMESLEGGGRGRGIACVPAGGSSIAQKSQLSEFLVVLMGLPA